MNRIKLILVLGLLFVGISTFAYDYFDISNPANPASPLNPANPASPANPINMENASNGCGCNRQITYDFRTSKIYEYCYKGNCIQTESSKKSRMIRNCLNNSGGKACLYKY